MCKSENIRWSRYKNNYFGIFLVPHISRPLFLYLILWKIIEFSQNKHLQRVGEQEIKTISENSIKARKMEDFLLSIISSPNIAENTKTSHHLCLASTDCQMCIVPDSPNKVYPQNPVPSSHFSFPAHNIPFSWGKCIPGIKFHVNSLQSLFRLEQILVQREGESEILPHSQISPESYKEFNFFSKTPLIFIQKNSPHLFALYGLFAPYRRPA